MTLLTTKQVASQFSVCKRTVGRWASAGQLKTVTIGGVTRFLQSDVDKFIQANRKSIAEMT